MGKFGPDSYLRSNFIKTINGVDTVVPNENSLKQVPTGYDQINLLQKIAFKPNSDWAFNWSN